MVSFTLKDWQVPGSILAGVEVFFIVVIFQYSNLCIQKLANPQLGFEPSTLESETQGSAH